MRIYLPQTQGVLAQSRCARTSSLYKSSADVQQLEGIEQVRALTFDFICANTPAESADVQ